MDGQGVLDANHTTPNVYAANDTVVVAPPIWTAINAIIVSGSFQSASPDADYDDEFLDIANGLIEANYTDSFHISSVIVTDVINYYIEQMACMQGKAHGT